MVPTTMQLVILEPLENEITRHVDMSMTFVAADHALLGRVDSRADPVNAAILDRNAAKLAQVQTGGGPLRVSRIDFPNRNGKQWSSLTNIILANDLVLIPEFDSDDPAVINNAKTNVTEPVARTPRRNHRSDQHEGIAGITPLLVDAGARICAAPTETVS